MILTKPHVPLRIDMDRVRQVLLFVMIFGFDEYFYIGGISILNVHIHELLSHSHNIIQSTPMISKSIPRGPFLYKGSLDTNSRGFEFCLTLQIRKYAPYLFDDVYPYLCVVIV